MTKPGRGMVKLNSLVISCIALSSNFLQVLDCSILTAGMKSGEEVGLEETTA